MNQQLKIWGRKYFFGFIWPLMALVSLNYHQSLLYPKGTEAWIYYLTTHLAQYGLFALVLNFVLYRPATLFQNFKIAKFWAIFLSVLAVTVLFIDTMIFSQYRYHINGFIIELLFSGAAQDIFDFPMSSFVIVALIIVSLLFFLNFIANQIWKKSSLNKTKSWYLILILICQLVANGTHAYARAVIKKEITVLTPLFPFYFPLTSNGLYKKMGFTPKVQPRFKQDQSVTDFFYPSEEMNCEKNDKLNILLIVIDSWRKDQLNSKVTEFLSEYQKDALVFDNHFSGSNNTRGGIYNIFYGLPSIYWTNTLNNQTPPVWIEEHIKNNYRFGIFAAASLAKPEFNQTVFSQIENLRLTTEGANSVEKDIKLTQEWKEWLSQNKDHPFFGFLFYDSPHAYAFPKDFKKEFSPMAEEMNYIKLNNSVDPTPYLNRHHKSVSFVDTIIKDVITDLKEKNLEDKTIVIITGDHGQELNDNKKNFWGHNSNYSPIQLMVPFIIKWPGKKPDHIKQLTTHYDLAPTIMSHLFKCTNPFDTYSYGQDLFNLENKNQFIAASYLDFALIDVNEERIMTVDQFGDYSVTDLNLNEINSKQVNRKNLIKHFSDLSRFKKPKK